MSTQLFPNCPLTAAERQAIDPLVASNSKSIMDLEILLERDVGALNFSQTLLARVEDDLASCTQLLDLHCVQREHTLREKSKFQQLKDDIVARRTTHMNTIEVPAQDIYSLLLTKIEASIVSLGSHYSVSDGVCAIMEHQIRRLCEEKEREQLVIAAKSNIVAAHRYHLESLKTIQASLTRRYAPQFRIPSETWSHIFNDCVMQSIDEYLENPGTEKMVYMPLHLAHVCRRWRQISLDTPRLWTTIDLSYMLTEDEPEPSPFLQNLLVLCQKHPIKFIFNLGDIQLRTGFPPTVICRIPTLPNVSLDVHLHIIGPVSLHQLGQADPTRIDLHCIGFLEENVFTYQTRSPHDCLYQGPVSFPSTGNLNFLQFGPYYSRVGIVDTPLQAFRIRSNIDIPFNRLVGFLHFSLFSVRQLQISSTFQRRYPGRIISMPNLETLGLILHPRLDIRHIIAVKLKELDLYPPRIEDDFNKCVDGMDNLLVPVEIIKCIKWNHDSQFTFTRCEELLKLLLENTPHLQTLRFTDCTLDATVLERILQGKSNINLALEYCHGITQDQCLALSQLVQHLTVVT
ncbi:hypothetical protein FRC17_006049 [Serendipita sp. 399]|nr:hypothetical protein FRC17_006049 [Serendipita sp. 399]